MHVDTLWEILHIIMWIIGMAAILFNVSAIIWMYRGVKKMEEKRND